MILSDGTEVERREDGAYRPSTLYKEGAGVLEDGWVEHPGTVHSSDDEILKFAQG